MDSEQQGINTNNLKSLPETLKVKLRKGVLFNIVQIVFKQESRLSLATGYRSVTWVG